MTTKPTKPRNLSEPARLAKNAKIREARLATKAKRDKQECKTFHLKIQANKMNSRQKEELALLFHEARWLRNAILASGKLKAYDTRQSEVVVKNKDGVLEHRELKQLGSQMKQAIQEQLLSDTRALAARKKAGYKVGKLKFARQVRSINLKQAGSTYRFKSKTKVKLQNLSGAYRLLGVSQLEGWELANGKLLQKPDGYYLAVTAYREKQEKVVQSGTVIGLDMGVKTHLTLSDGTKIDAIVKETERLKRLQRQLARQQKGSNRYSKTCHAIRKEYQKMDWKKDDLANKLVNQLLDHELVFFQNENLSAWRVRSNKYKNGRRLQHSVLGRVKAKLARAENAVMLRSNAPTTQSCVCGIKTPHHVSLRQFTCASCGYNDDRDIHAAKNMIRLGAGAAPVRSQELVERVSDWRSSDFQQFAAKREASKLLVSV